MMNEAMMKMVDDKREFADMKSIIKTYAVLRGVKTGDMNLN
jgi:hypothetical protein